MRRNKGITLIALVVTIVVLIILAAVSIGTLIGKNGTITKAQEAKKEHEIGEEREIVDLSALQAASEEEYGIITEDKLRKALEENMGGRSFSLDVEETQFVITFNDSGRKYYVPKEMQIPTDNDIKFTYEPSGWTNQDVTVTVEVTLEGYTIETSKNGTDWNETNKLVYSENGKVYVKLIKENGEAYEEIFEREVTNIDKSKPVITGATGEENSIKLTATDDISGIVGYTATTSNLTPNSFTSCSSTKALKVTIPNIQENITYYVWVKDAAGNISIAKTVQISNKDKTPPTITEVETTTNSIRLTATDEESGIIGYTATTNNTTPSNFTSCTNTKTLNATIENLTQNTTYYVWAKDEAGNISVAKTTKTQKVPDLTTANVSFTYSPSGWTNGNVTATASTTASGYTIETSTDNKAWTATNKQTRSNNGPVYVRLKDSTGQVGGVATGNVTKIDKNAPSATISLSGAGTVTSNPTIYATVNHTDDASGVKTRKYVLNTNGGTIGTDEASYTGTFNENNQQVGMALSSIGNYYIHVLTIDNAGNKKETISKQIRLTGNRHNHSGSSSGGGCYTSPVYHQHTGNSTSGGGCYIIPVYHKHTDDCGMTERREYVYSSEHSTDVSYTDSNGIDWCWYTCPKYGERYIGQGYDGGSHWHTFKEYDCKKDEDKTIDEYNLGCEKTAGSTIEYYNLGCGLQVGQLVSYEISY